MTHLAIITDENEARNLTDRAIESLSQSWQLLIECWVREARKLVGYSSWRPYALTEFDIGQAGLCQLFDHGKSIRHCRMACLPWGTSQMAAFPRRANP